MKIEYVEREETQKKILSSRWEKKQNKTKNKNRKGGLHF